MGGATYEVVVWEGLHIANLVFVCDDNVRSIWFQLQLFCAAKGFSLHTEGQVQFLGVYLVVQQPLHQEWKQRQMWLACRPSRVYTKRAPVHVEWKMIKSTKKCRMRVTTETLGLYQPPALSLQQVST